MIAQLLLISTMTAAQTPGPSAHDKYCSQLSVRNTEAEMYRSDPENYNRHWKEISDLQTAILGNIETEALAQKMSFEQYREHMLKESGKLGHPIKLSEFHRAQYVSNLFQSICLPMEASAPAGSGSRAAQPTQLFRPFETKGLPSFKPFNTQSPKSTK